MYKPYADSTLLKMTKKKVVEQLRVAEHNFFAAEHNLNQQAENLKDWKPVVHGRWIVPVPGDGNPYCSHCLTEPYYSTDIHTLKYCPNCGAKMDGKDGAKNEN